MVLCFCSQNLMASNHHTPDYTIVFIGNVMKILDITNEKIILGTKNNILKKLNIKAFKLSLIRDLKIEPSVFKEKFLNNKNMSEDTPLTKEFVDTMKNDKLFTEGEKRRYNRGLLEESIFKYTPNTIEETLTKTEINFSDCSITLSLENIKIVKKGVIDNSEFSKWRFKEETEKNGRYECTFNKNLDKLQCYIGPEDIYIGLLINLDEEGNMNSNYLNKLGPSTIKGTLRDLSVGDQKYYCDIEI